MELFLRVQELAVGIILAAIAWNIIVTIFKRDFNKFFINMLLCGFGLFLVQSPQTFMDLSKEVVTFAVGFIVEILKTGGK